MDDQENPQVEEPQAVVPQFEGEPLGEDQMYVAHKALNTFSTQEIDLKLRIGKFESNDYPTMMLFTFSRPFHI